MKSVEIKFAEAMEALRKADRVKEFQEKTKHFTSNVTIETKLNAAEAVLKDAGIVRESRRGDAEEAGLGTALTRLSHEQFQLFSKKCAANPRMSGKEKLQLAESIFDGKVVETVRKNNGRYENFVEGSPFQEPVNFSDGYVRESNPASTREAIHKRLDIIEADTKLRAGVITEAAHAILVGGDPTIPAGLTSLQAKEYKHYVAIGLKEAQALKLCKMPNVFRGTQI